MTALHVILTMLLVRITVLREKWDMSGIVSPYFRLQRSAVFRYEIPYRITTGWQCQTIMRFYCRGERLFAREWISVQAKGMKSHRFTV